MVDLNKIKLPHIIKDKILMSPGIWNNFYYSAEEIKKSFSQTNWSSKEIRSLFLDHDDDKSREWIGEIINPRLVGDTLKGDLVIVDQPTAIKLVYGAKMGISPKVTGQTEEGENIMLNFNYDNFSVVINPAVKTAWINNSEMVAFEKIRKEKGMTPEEFYAIPMDPPSASKLPIYDAAHVRNALARFNQVKGVSEEQIKTAKAKIIAAAKKFNIKVDKTKLEVENMTDETISPEANIVEMSDVDQELLDYTDFIKLAQKEHAEWSLENIAKEYEKQKDAEEEKEQMGNLMELADLIVGLADKIKALKPKEEDPEEEPEDGEEKPTEKPKEDDEEEKENQEDDKDDKEDEKPKDDKKPEEKPKEVPKEEPKKEVPKDGEEDDEKDELKKENQALMQKINDLNKNHTQTLNQMKDQFDEIKKKMDEPDKLSVKTVSMANKTIPIEISGNEDNGFLSILKDDFGGK